MRQSVKLAKRLGDAAPVRLRLGRPAFDVGHHDQAVKEVPPIPRGDRHRHGHPFTVKVSQQLGFPAQVGFTSSPEPSNSQLPVDAHAPHFVDAPASERLDPSDIVTPLIERVPSHSHHLRETS